MFFAHNRFSTFFFKMKITESEKIVLVNCIINFEDIHISLRPFSLILNTCKVMEAFLIFSGQNLKKTTITLQALRLKLNGLNEICTSSKLIMQPIEKKTVVVRKKVNFCGQKDFIHRLELVGRPLGPDSDRNYGTGVTRRTRHATAAQGWRHHDWNTTAA